MREGFDSPPPHFLILKSNIMTEETLRATNMAAFKKALTPMQVIEKGKIIFVADEDSPSGFIAQSTVNKVASACCLYGFSGYYICDNPDYGICFRIY